MLKITQNTVTESLSVHQIPPTLRFWFPVHNETLQTLMRFEETLIVAKKVIVACLTLINRVGGLHGRI